MKALMTIITIIGTFGFTIFLAIEEAKNDFNKKIYNHAIRWLKRSGLMVLCSALFHLFNYRHINVLCYGDILINHLVCNAFLCFSLGLCFIVAFNIHINELKNKEFDYLGSISGWDKFLSRFFGHYYLLIFGSFIGLIMYIGYVFQNC